MLLYRGIITLDYDPSTDVLTTSMPDMKQFALPEVNFCLDLLVESIRNYDIKNLLLDSCKSVIEVDEEAYKTIARKFAIDLMSTRLKRIARVQISDKKMEQKYEKLSLKLWREVDLSLVFRNFTCHAAARNWLVSKDLILPV